MFGYTIIPDEEVKRMYPKGGSYIAKVAHRALEKGYKLASIKNNELTDNKQLAARICASIVEDNCFNKMKYVVDFSKLDNKEVIVAFDDKTNH